MKRLSLSTTALAGWPGLCAAAVLILDQLTKLLVCRAWPIPGKGGLVLIPGFFRLVHWRNLGAAWGIFAGRTWALGCFSLLVSLVLVLFWRRITEGKRGYAIPCGILLGGILGNMVDRFFYPEGVIDFLRFEFWPAFNVADSAITCSVVSLIIYELFLARRTSGKDSEEKSS